MKLHIIFIGNKFVYNKTLNEYVMRKIEQKIDFIDSIVYFKESDNSLFLYLQEELNSDNKIIIVTTKQNFSTIGKLICTATNDNQVLKNGILIPQNSTLFQDGTYLLEHENAMVNVLQVDEGQEIPEVLMFDNDSSVTFHVFEEDKETTIAILNPIAQTYDVSIDVSQEVSGWLSVHASCNKYGNITKFTDAAKKLLQKSLIVTPNIVAHVIERLTLAQKKVTFAESCTGGLLAYYFTKNNGTSNILEGSLVTYSNALKENWLAVSHDILQEYGAVSAEVVSEMSDGALNVSDADYALSISGIAGEGGGTQLKPVGTVYIGVRTKNSSKEEHLLFSGDRNYIQDQSAMYAIKMLLLSDKELFF
ncbi:MAG: CinA family protein [Sulfurimonas sp.]